MDSIESKLTLLQKLLVILSWKKLAQFTVFLLMVFLAWLTYETRDKVYEVLTQPKIQNRSILVTKISKPVQDQIEAAVIKSDLINAIQITMVDFQKNSRTVIYTTIDNPELEKAYKKFADLGFVELPLFNSDLINNKRMVDLINGEFICNPYVDTIGARIVPESTKFISTVCANGIPPYYGKFTGIVSIYTKRPPTPEEIDQLRTLAKTLSTTIYEKEFK